MNGVVASLWKEVSKDLGFPSLRIHSNNPARSQDWVAATWAVVVDPALDRYSPTDLARARLDAQALVEVHNEVVRRLDPQRAWQADRYRVDDLQDLPDLVIGYLAADYLLAPTTGERRERVTLLEGILYGRTREVVRDHAELLQAQLPLIAATAGVDASAAQRQDVLRRFR